ncbi:hypothetical protein UT300012_22720 [Paraclostridium bifermentans]
MNNINQNIVSNADSVKYFIQKYQLEKAVKISLGISGVVSSIQLACTHNIQINIVLNMIVMFLTMRTLNRCCLPRTKPSKRQMILTFTVLIISTTLLGLLAIELTNIIRIYSVAVALGITLTMMIYNKVLTKVLVFYYAVKVMLVWYEERVD